jgi:hypothetical protein
LTGAEHDRRSEHQPCPDCAPDRRSGSCPKCGIAYNCSRHAYAPGRTASIIAEYRVFKSNTCTVQHTFTNSITADSGIRTPMMTTGCAAAPEPLSGREPPPLRDRHTAACRWWVAARTNLTSRRGWADPARGQPRRGSPAVLRDRP